MPGLLFARRPIRLSPFCAPLRDAPSRGAESRGGRKRPPPAQRAKLTKFDFEGVTSGVLMGSDYKEQLHTLIRTAADPSSSTNGVAHEASVFFSTYSNWRRTSSEATTQLGTKDEEDEDCAEG